MATITAVYSIISVKAALDCATLMTCHTVPNARKQPEVAQCKWDASHDSVMVSQHAQNVYPECIIHTCAFMSECLKKTYDMYL